MFRGLVSIISESITYPRSDFRRPLLGHASMIQDTCPDTEQLHRLLSEQLDPREEAELAGHIERCEHCHQELEKMTCHRVPGRTDAGMAGPETIDPDTSATRGWTFHPDPPAGPGAKPSHALPTISGYELLEKLGEGGMGVVYLARQTGLNRRVAVKMIRGGSQARPDLFARFRIEAEAVARLRHPNIIQIHEIGEVNGLPFVSLELLEGGSLADRLEGTPQPARQTAELLLTLASAIQVAHDVGIIHRDLKPSNVLFTEDGTPIITDFGLAKRIDSDSRQTETGQIMGSPSYMAPEQAQGHTREVGRAADVYALGAILYEMLTGRPPFKGETPMETVRQVIDDEVVPPSRLVPKVDRDLETICLKCLSKEPPRRYASASALAEDLDRHRKGESIHARRASPVERGVKWARRRPAAAALYALGLAAFLGLTVGAAFYEHNQRVAEASKNQHALDEHKTVGRLAVEAREASTAEELSRVQNELSSRLGSLSKEVDPRLKILSDTIMQSIGEVERKLRALRHREEKEKQDQADRRRFQSFLDQQTQAEFHAAGFELDPSDSRIRLRDAARAGLAIYALDPKAGDESWSLASTLPEVLADSDKARIAAGCYDLLLLLSDAVEPATGLKILDRAARLHPQPTAAYHLRRAGCLARLGDTAGQHREQELAAKLPAATALDHFLIGREQLASRPLGRGHHLARSVAAARSRPDPGSPAAGPSLFQREPQAAARSREQPEPLHQEPSRHRGALPDARPGRGRGGEPGAGAEGSAAPRPAVRAPAAGRPGIPGCRAGLRRRARPSANRRLSLRAAGEPGRHVLAGRQLRQVACRSRGRPSASGRGRTRPI